MPLLHRNPFVPNDIPADLDPEEKVYYCEATGEIFRNFEDYFERQITLDTEVWSCSISGKSNLTFDEAVESEESARETLKTVDKILVKAILYLFSKATGRISVRTLANEIFEAIKEKYFVGEVVTYQKKRYRVRNIKSKTNNQKDSDEENKSPEKSNSKKDFEYQIVIEDKKDGVIKSVSSSELGRKINLPRVISYVIKTNAKQSETNKSWGITSRATKKNNLDDFLWLDVFPGDEPKFETIIPKEIKQKKPKKPLVEVNKNDKIKKETKKESKISEEEKRAKIEKERAERRKIFEAAKREWSKPKPDETLDDFNSFLLPPPQSISTKIPHALLGDVFQIIEFHRNFSNAFGDMQYVSHLRKLGLKQMEEILYSNDTQGTFCDMLFYYIQAIRYCFDNEKNEANMTDCPYSGNFLKIDMPGNEDEEEEDDDVTAMISDSPERSQEAAESEAMELSQTSQNSQETSMLTDEEIAWPIGAGYVPEDCVTFSSRAALWSVRCLGRPVHELQVDEATCTEVLRMTILSMAAEMRQAITTYRKTYRGGWDNEEDNLIMSLRDENAVRIFRKMETTSVFDFKPEEKLFILNFLNDAVVSQNDGRQVMDDAIDEMTACRRHLSEGYRNEKQRNRDFTAKIGDLETRIKEEGDQPEPEIPKESYTRSRQPGKKEKPKMTAKMELEETLEEHEQLKEVHEDMIKRLNEQHIRNEIKMRSQLLGYDRFFRRYWLMSGCAGILVEVPNISELPVMHNGSSWKAFEIPKQVPKPTMAKTKLETDSDSEDDLPLAKMAKSNSQTNLPNGIANGEKELSEKVEGPENKMDIEIKIENADWSTAPTLCDEYKWFVYSTKEDLEKLINSLNERGEREKDLKQNLVKYSSLCHFAQENIYDTTRDRTDFIIEDEFAATKASTLQVRDYLLDLEERIYHADFGDAFEDDTERKLWREFWEKGGQGNPDVIEIDFVDKLKSTGDVPPRLPLPIHLIPRKIPSEIQNLAASLILMGRALKNKSQERNSNVLCRPLGNANKSKKKKSRKSEGNWTGRLCWGFKYWCASLMTVTSSSGLYLHCVHFDECINWDKSPENIRCSICKKKSDAETMLICDECDLAYHMACHKPKVKKIPAGDWFCYKCAHKRKQAASPVKKRRRVAEDEEIDGVFVSDRPRKRKKVNYAE